jgi:AcrR family transcriptional regulator
VRHVIERAGVSRATFYQQFDDLQDCIIAAYGAASECLIREISDACASQHPWPEGVVAAVDAGLEFTVTAPAQACLLLAGINASNRHLARCGRATCDQLAGLLRRGRELYPEAAARPELVEQALIGGVASVIGARLTAGQLDRLPQLRPELIQFLLTPYLGDVEAFRVATPPRDDAVDTRQTPVRAQYRCRPD